MEFKVKFTGTGAHSAVRFEWREAGIADLDLARRTFPGIPAEKVAGIIGSFYTSPEIRLEEATARAAGHFHSCGSITVRVPAGGLNSYVDIVPVKKDGGVGWQYVIREADIVAAWIRAGFPTEWMD